MFNRDNLAYGLRKKTAVFAALLVIALIFASGGLFKRLGVEWSHRAVAMVIDYRDLTSLSRQGKIDPVSLYGELSSLGVVGITAAEFTGKDLSNGVLPLKYGSISSLLFTSAALSNFSGDRAVITISSKEPLFPKILAYLKIRFDKLTALPSGANTLIVLPGAVDEYGDSGLLPDFNAFFFASHVGATALYRPNPALGIGGEAVANSIASLKSQFPELACIIPAGIVLAGYPEVAPIAEELKKENIAVAQVEFIKQIGTDRLNFAARPLVLPLHSLVRDEIFSRRLTRPQIVDRMIRAVHERSIKILLVRPYDIYNAQRLPFFVEDLKSIRDALTSRGYAFEWPSTLPMWERSLGGALACAAVFVACVWFHWRRYRDEDEYKDDAPNENSSADRFARLEAIILGASILIIGLAAWKIGIVTKLLGGLTASMIATEATLWALGGGRNNEKPFIGLLTGLLIVLAGGLVIASFYGTTVMMLRLATFSGVKLTLLLPPVLVLLHDFKRKIHPEPLGEIVMRPPLWGELIICLALIGAAAFMAIRSDNVSYVPDWEVRFREVLERLLWIRPRTKEFLIGYPCLVLYYAVVKRGWLGNYREVLRIGASLGFASAVNTFCHFHTLLPLSVIRVVNGWWLGIVIGFMLVVVMNIAAPFAVSKFARRNAG